MCDNCVSNRGDFTSVIHLFWQKPYGLTDPIPVAGGSELNHKTDSLCVSRVEVLCHSVSAKTSVDLMVEFSETTTYSGAKYV